MLIEEKVNKLISDSIKDLGYDIVRVKYCSGKNSTLQIMLDRLDGQEVTINDCSKVSKIVSTILDVEAPINEGYNLEISSPGIDRPLVKLEDFIKFKGKKVKVILKYPQEDIRKFKGEILNIEENTIILKLQTGVELKIDYSNIDSANLIMSDSLFK
jgi:ribosome maturation factor RimP